MPLQAVRAASDSKSLVLLDEVGTGTEPVEGSALGVALLETLVKGGQGGAGFTMATTHHRLGILLLASKKLCLHCFYKEHAPFYSPSWPRFGELTSFGLHTAFHFIAASSAPARVWSKTVELA